MSSPSVGPSAPYPQQPYPQQPYPQQPYPQQPYQAPPGYQYPPQQYPQYPPQQMPPPIPPHPRRGLIIGAVVGVIVIVIVAFLLVGYLAGWFGTSPKTSTMSCSQFASQVQIDYVNYRITFTNLNPGDTLIIRDTITNIYYSSYSDQTWVTLGSGGPGCYLTFSGDITSTYSTGNTVEVTFHVINFDINMYGIHMSGEYFREMIDPVTNMMTTEVEPSIMRKIG